jgi:hypothetical protein
MRNVNFWEDFGIHIEIILAGVLGGLLSLEDKKGLSTWEKIGVFMSGGVISNYLTPIIVDWTGIGQNYTYGLAFLLGYTGLTGVKILVLYIHRKFLKKKD